MNKRYLLGLYKRVFVVLLFLMPALFAIDYFLRASSNALRVSVMVLVAMVAVGVVELIRYKKTLKNK